ncbi:MAG: hypothetical protein HRU13_13210 [Phycisphaerales bacterium]|nr:hypothetical protein [Phycisphaerales bacterium]
MADYSGLPVGGDYVTDAAGGTWYNAPDGSPVYDLVSFGGDLYASGPFMFVEGDIRSGIARFDGDSWSVPVSDDQRISSTEFWPLLSWSIDGRDVLISSGRFSISQDGETIARNVAAWDGDRWSALPGVGVLDQEGQPIAMTLFDDGSGEALFIGGGNSRGRTEQVNRWKAGSFGPVIGRSTDTVFSLAVFDNGSGLSLYAGGRFEGFARWRPAPACSIDLTGDCVADLFDFLEFQNLFDAGDDRVDFDGDGRLTLFDFLAFQNAFDAGCP